MASVQQSIDIQKKVAGDAGDSEVTRNAARDHRHRLADVVAKAIKKFGIDPEKADPMSV